MRWMVWMWLAGCTSGLRPYGWADDGLDVAAPLAPRVLVNEIAPGNDSLATDEWGDFDDYVELVNADTAPVRLEGMSLEVDGIRWPLPSDRILEPGEHLLLWADARGDQGPLHARVALSDDGGSVRVFSIDGALCDSVDYPAVPDDVVVGRFPSGSDVLAASIAATPGEPNPDDPGADTDPSVVLFPQDRVLRFDLALSPDALASLDASPYTEVPATLTWSGLSFEVTARIKGQAGSLRDIDDKAAFKIDLNRAVDGQALRGLSKLTLNNLVQDTSAVHERLTYALLDAVGAPSARTAYAELWINGERRGLYLHLESMDDDWVARTFAHGGGNLYEGEYGQDIPWGGWNNLEQDIVGADDVADRADLAGLAALLEQTPDPSLEPALHSWVDVDRTLATLAVEVAVGHWDGYQYYPNNWRIYHDPVTGQFTLITSGVDQTWAWSDDPYRTSGDLAGWMLAIPAVRDAFSAQLVQASDAMRAMDVPGRVAADTALIRPFVEADPYRAHTVDAHDAAVAATLAWAAARPDALDSQIGP